MGTECSWKIYRERWITETDEEGELEKSVLSPQLDDDDGGNCLVRFIISCLKPYNCVQTNIYHWIEILLEKNIIIRILWEYLKPYIWVKKNCIRMEYLISYNWVWKTTLNKQLHKKKYLWTSSERDFLTFRRAQSAVGCV